MLLIPIIFNEIMSTGIEDGVKYYSIQMKKHIYGMDMVKPPDKYLNTQEIENDITGLFPLYIYNYPFDC